MEPISFAIYFAISLLINLALSALTAKAPETYLKAAGLDEFTFPTAEEDRQIPYVVGDVLQKAPNLSWYGNYRKEEIKKKVATGAFNTNHKNITIGFNYYLAWEVIICLGPVDEFLEIRYGDKTAWSGLVTAPSGVEVIPVRGQGLTHNVELYRGIPFQPISQYMRTRAGHSLPVAPFGFRHNHICKAVFRQGRIGDSPSVKLLSFRLGRYPNNLALSSEVSRLPNGSNAAEVIYELVTGKYLRFSNQPIAPHIPENEVNANSFRAAAPILASEGFGINFAWQRDAPPRKLVDDILVTINGFLRENPTTGLVELTLLRDGVPDGLRRFGRSNCVGFESIQRQAINSLVNRVNYRFTQKGDNFDEVPGALTSLAVLAVTDEEVTADLDLTMLHSKDAANLRAQWHLNSLSIPAYSGTILGDHRAWGVGLGDKIIVDLESGDSDIPSVTNLVCVVNRIDVREAAERKINIGFVQDIFSVGTTVVGSIPDSEETDFFLDLAPVTNYLVIETPYGLLNGASPTTLTVFAERPNEATASADFYIARDSGELVLSMEQEGLAYRSQLMEFLPVSGAVNSGSAPFIAYLDNHIQPEGVEVDFESIGISYLVEGLTNTEINNTKANIFLIGSELVGVLAWTPIAVPEGELPRYRVTNYLRGLYGTIPQEHAAGTYMWYLGQAQVIDDVIMAPGTDWSLLIRTSTDTETTPLEDVTPITGTVVGSASLPWPPGDLSVNSNSWAVSGNLPLSFSWNRRNKDNPASYYSSQDQASFGENYTIRLYNVSTNALLHTYTGPEDTWSYTAEMSQTDGDPLNVRFEVTTVVDSVESQPIIWEVNVTGGWL